MGKSKKFVFKSPGISIRESHSVYNPYTPSIEETIKSTPIEYIMEIIGIENVENCLRKMKINKIKNK